MSDQKRDTERNSIEFLNQTDDGDIVVPVVRDPHFQRLNPNVFSIWTDRSGGSFRFDALLMRSETRETEHRFVDEATQLRKKVILETCEVGMLCLDVLSACRLVVQLKGALATVPEEVFTGLGFNKSDLVGE